jgi:hypothetical protein
VDIGNPHNSAFMTSDKAELSRFSAHTKFMTLRHKAELSSLPAQTKLMPLRYKKLFQVQESEN